MNSPSRKLAARRSERGYILITLILFVALLVIAAGVMAPLISFQVKRDREEELIHRGVQYSRAMKHFVKKFGRYPTRLEELENTNQIRFLRKRYKDPVTGKDFKILHLGDVQFAAGGGIAGATPVNGINPATGGPGGPLGGPGGAANSLGLAGGLGAAGTNPGGAIPTTPGPNGAGGQNRVTGAPDSQDQNDGEDPSQTVQNSTPGQGQAGGPASGPNPPGGLGTTGSNNGGAQVFGGGPVVGVASISREKSIRVFNKKDHYYQWQFIYDPNTDRGCLLTTPNQPALPGSGTISTLQPGAPGAPATPGGVGGAQGQPPGNPQGQPGMQPPQMPPDQTQP